VTNYYFNGLHITSELPLIPLTPLSPNTAEQAQVFIRLGAVPSALEQPLKQTATFMLTQDSALISIPGVARFLVEHGSHITIAVNRNCPLNDISTFVTSIVWSALSYQRSQRLLKGALINIGGQTWLLSGLSPVGSSTFALAMQTYFGAQVISDEFCSYQPTERGIMVQPGIPAIKLWRDSLNFLERDAELLEPVRSRLNKYWLPLAPYTAQPLQLTGIIGLQEWRSDDVSPVGIKPLSGFKALKRIYHHGYHPVYMQNKGAQQQKFQQDLHLVQQCNMLSFVFKRGWPSLQTSCEQLAIQLTKQTTTQLIQRSSQ
jgi:hypothetical protein